MILKAKIANKVKTTDSGLIEGTIIQVLEIPERFEDSKGHQISKEDYLDLKNLGKKVRRFDPQFEFQIEAAGTQKCVTYRIWTRQTLNNEKYKKPNGVVDYNSLTRLMLQLELITYEELTALDTLSNFNIDSAEGLKVQFELETSKKQKGLKIPKLTSIKPIKLKD